MARGGILSSSQRCSRRHQRTADVAQRMLLAGGTNCAQKKIKDISRSESYGVSE